MMLTKVGLEALADLPKEFYKLIEPCESNAVTIINYRSSMRNEISTAPNYEKINIKTLVYLSKFHQNKTFKSMNKDDILSF